ncbi:MAG TPA: hypothetical protein VH370_01300 [Humisphaera sp.]|jgi:hypothetical protein|nr:hypothetical protein [Humisphaera sp.]
MKRKSNKWPAGIKPLTDARSFEALSPDDQERISRYFDGPIAPRDTRPLTDAEWDEEKRSKRKMGRPKIGQGAKVVAVTLEKGLLERVDAYARRRKLKRAQVITQGLRIVLGEDAA